MLYKKIINNDLVIKLDIIGTTSGAVHLTGIIPPCEM